MNAYWVLIIAFMTGGPASATFVDRSACQYAADVLVTQRKRDVVFAECFARFSRDIPKEPTE